MKKEYLVTIAMPIYNVALFVERSLLSALNQTYPSIEYLLIDDKGQDGSMTIVDNLLKKHQRSGDVRIIDQIYNQKTGAARNAGIDNATGQYIFFMDSDDLLAPDCIEKLYDKMKEYPVDFVAGAFHRLSVDGHVFNSEIYVPINKFIGDESISVVEYQYMYSGNIYPMACNKLYSLSFLRDNQIRCIPHFIIEDPWFTYQVVLSAKSCSIIPNVTYYYLVNEASVTAIRYSEINARQYVETQKLKSEYIKSWVKKRVYPALLNDIIFMSVYNAYMIFDSAMKGIIIWQTADEICRRLLKRDFLLPKRVDANLPYLKFVLGMFYFGLPMVIKISLIRFIVKIRLKQRVRGWLHF